MENEKDAALSTKAAESLALNVLKAYGISPESLTMVQGGSIKTVWKLSSNGRRLCLKRLKQTMDKAAFSVNAQIYVQEAGGKVPGVILNKSGQPITEYKEQLFVVYDWVNGNDLNFGIQSDLKQAIQGLAAFHKASKGYAPDEQARVSTKLGKWPEQYASMKNKLTEWKKAARNNTANPAHQAYYDYVDSVIGIAGRAIERLNTSKYAKLTEPGSTSIVLCHQDFGRGNVLSAADGTYVLDLDGVTLDLPARDLRKIIGKLAGNAGNWSAETIRGILGWYTEINPLSEDEKQVLYIDLMFPHRFYGLVKNLYQNVKALKASEIERTAKLEEAGEELLKTMLEKE
ncbi:MAG TPA: CotS family spore coat protein [Clostridia bacterium]|nr:CotS family spore coat protein [Clostridia bacterium]